MEVGSENVWAFGEKRMDIKTGGVSLYSGVYLKETPGKVLS
jgi:hypothetical protein